MAIVVMYRKFREIWTCCILRYVSGQTDRHTDTLMAILLTSIGGRLIAKLDDTLAVSLFFVPCCLISSTSQSAFTLSRL